MKTETMTNFERTSGGSCTSLGKQASSPDRLSAGALLLKAGNMTPQLQHLQEADALATALLAKLRDCYGESDPLAEMLLRPMVSKVTEIEGTLRAIVQSKAGAK